ncbi:MAG TPA: class I SAM-dependent methyltransferase [Ignisphaera sp.]|uniref:Class I SAM-dependent methyltransferase n=1 Tax=Ignisphaera aggregans TaxID=334771 RepID=A0A832Z2T7_9CREN|nr:class I SAM-dependent methyltransferase [Ignisphaera sp.]HIP56873.1 class I SAM-dependent methyltransferase [Ignisphaera aggregans]
MGHYYSSARRRSLYMLISDYIRGVTVEFETAAGLFSYETVDKGTKLLLEVAEIPESGTVLDLGCGYGVIGIVLAKLNPKLRVYMVDINREAVKLAKRNIKRNRVEDRVTVLLGDLYEPVKGMKFVAIYSNPPLAAGMDVVKRMITEAPNYLEPGGTLQIVVRKGAETVRKCMERTFGNVKQLVSKGGYKVFLSRKEV